MREGASLARARAALGLGRAEDAAREAGLAVAANPEDPNSYYVLAIALRLLGKLDEALGAVASGMSKAPWWHDLFVARSDILRDKKQPLDARAAAQEAVRLGPDDPDCHAALALSESALGNHAEAILSLRRAAALAPDAPRVHRMLGHEHLALGDNEQAVIEYERALGTEPNDALALNNLGCALLRLKREEEAVLAFKSAVLVDPTMKEAKSNVHDVVGGVAKGASVLGVVGLAAAKLKVFWVLVLLRGVLHQPSFWLVVVAIAGIVVAVLAVRGRRRLRRLGEKDPQLLALYERLKADKKAGRL